MRSVDLSLAAYKPINKYVPMVGDFVVWHGFLSHWYGLINGVSQDKIKIIKAGMPNLLFSMSQSEMEDSVHIIDLSKVQRSRGAYAILQGGIWFI